MSKPRKIKRTKNIYGKKKRINKKVMNTILFILLIIVLVAMGFIITQQFDSHFGRTDGDKNVSSQSNAESEIQSQPDVSEQDEPESNTQSESSENSVENTKIYSKMLMPEEFIGKDFNIILNDAKAQGYNAVTLYLKTEDGKIHYNASSETVTAYNAVSEQVIDIAAAVEAGEKAGVKVTAAISTLKDAVAPHVRNNNSYAYGNTVTTNWLDDSPARGGKPWLNPYMDNTKTYIAGICKELSDAGVKTIYLDNLIFPDRNTKQMNTIKTTPSKTEALQEVVKSCTDAVGENAKIIVATTPSEVLVNSAQAYPSSIESIDKGGCAVYLSADKMQKKQKEIAAAIGVSEDSGQKEISEAIIKAAENKDVVWIGSDAELSELGIKNNVNCIIK